MSQSDPVSQLLLGTAGDRLLLAVLFNTLKRLSSEDRW